MPVLRDGVSSQGRRGCPGRPLSTDETVARGMAAVSAQRGDAAIDTGLRAPFKVYWFKLMHPLLARRGRFLLQGRQHRRYFVMPGDYVSGYTAKFGSFEAEEIAVARLVCERGQGIARLASNIIVEQGRNIGLRGRGVAGPGTPRQLWVCSGDSI